MLESRLDISTLIKLSLHFFMKSSVFNEAKITLLLGLLLCLYIYNAGRSEPLTAAEK